MRSMFIARSGYKFVNADVDSCQFFALAHRMGDPSFTEAIVNGDPDKGTDLHSINAKVWSEALDVDLPRKKAKNGGFALIFGAQAPKLGTTLLGPAGTPEHGKRAKVALDARFPLLGQLINRLQAQADSLGYINGIDGRRIFVDLKHKALNYDCQSIESIWVKHWMVNCDKLITDRGIDAHLIIQYHDELSWECRPEYIDELKDIIQIAARQANETLGLNPAMRVSPAVGTSWFDSH